MTDEEIAEAATLLTVIERTMGHDQTLKSIREAATLRLLEIDAEAATALAEERKMR